MDGEQHCLRSFGDILLRNGLGAYPTFPYKSFERVLLLAQTRKILMLFCSHLVNHEINADPKPRI